MSTSSAMNPGLIFCLMICPLSLGGSITLFRFGMPIPASALLAICCWPIGIVGWQLIRFTIKEPDRLQRDEHLQRMFELKSTVGIKDHGQIKEVTVSSQLATNPALENRSEEAQAGE